VTVRRVAERLRTDAFLAKAVMACKERLAKN